MSLSNTEKHVKDIRRKTRRKFSSEEKIKRITIIPGSLNRPLDGGFSITTMSVITSR